MGKLEKVTVELDSETVAAAAAAGLDLSKELTLALRRRLPLPTAQDREEAARRWQAENRERDRNLQPHDRGRRIRLFRWRPHVLILPCANSISSKT